MELPLFPLPRSPLREPPCCWELPILSAPPPASFWRACPPLTPMTRTRRSGSWASGNLTILDWPGDPNNGGGTDQRYFGSDTNGITSAQLSLIKFQDPVG